MLQAHLPAGVPFARQRIALMGPKDLVALLDTLARWRNSGSNSANGAVHRREHQGKGRRATMPTTATVRLDVQLMLVSAVHCGLLQRWLARLQCCACVACKTPFASLPAGALQPLTSSQPDKCVAFLLPSVLVACMFSCGDNGVVQAGELHCERNCTALDACRGGACGAFLATRPCARRMGRRSIAAAGRCSDRCNSASRQQRCLHAHRLAAQRAAVGDRQARAQRRAPVTSAHVTFARSILLRHCKERSMLSYWQRARVLLVFASGCSVALCAVQCGRLPCSSLCL